MGVFGADDVFMDVDNIQRGESFAETLNAQLRKSDVLLAVIGKRWLTLADQAGTRRLDHPDDWVRAEVGQSLASGLLVIPVLVGGAALPSSADLPEDIRALTANQQAEVRDGAWADDIARLCKDIKRRRARGSWTERLRVHRVSAALVILAVATGTYSAYAYMQGNRVAVPLVTGAGLDRASRALTDAGLHVGSVSKRATNEFPPDWVLEQDPPTQVALRKGSAVALTVAMPKAVDLTPFVVVRDVGQEGTVAAAACATAISAFLTAQGRPMQVSMRYLYEKAKRHDEATGEGTFLETTIYVARQFGAPPEEMWPYKSLDRKLPPGATWDQLDRAAAAQKARLTQLGDLDAVLGALDKGTPVIVAAAVTPAWTSDAVSKTGNLPSPGTGESIEGITVVTIVGYDPATQRYKFANNWGSGWGDKGFGTFSTADAKAVLQFDTGLWAVSVPTGQK